jgi:2'-5' RNA ligase
VRLFAAVVPPPEVLAHLDAALEPVRDDVIRWTLPESWHLTLAFYGEVPDERVPELVERLRRAARRHPAAELRFAGAGRFDGRVLWIGCDGSADLLRRLARSCAAAGRRSGAAAQESRRFRPHLTLARTQHPVDLRRYVDALAGYAGPDWAAGEIALIRSYLGQGPGRRSRYETVATLALAS